ncbi:MAG TPA: peroxiredoxin [Candidatus Tumulicola sp.]|jgi:peroxiredoxin Q/BCP
MLQAGDRLPKLDVVDDAGRHLSTTDLAAGTLVLYFYPKDDTPGCTSEAAQFRDAFDEFERRGATIVGVSRDSVESHQRFKKKYGIPYPLIADTDSRLCDAFGVIVEKTMYGIKRMGLARSTFVIDAGGSIVKVWPNVKVVGHVQAVLASLA